MVEAPSRIEAENDAHLDALDMIPLAPVECEGQEAFDFGPDFDPDAF